MREEEQAALRKQEIDIMDTLKEVVKNGRIETRSQPAVVIENKEPPEIPELRMGEMTESPFTGEDAVRYLARLSLGRQKRNTGKGGGGGGGGTKERETQGHQENENEDVSAISAGNGRSNDKEGGNSLGEEDGGNGLGDEEILREGVQENIDVDESTVSSPAGSQDQAEDSAKMKKKKKRKRRRKPKRSGPTMEEIRRANLEELERETREIIREAAETLNRNQTPVLRRSPPKVYKMPMDGPVLPVRIGKGSSQSKSPTTPKDNTPTKRSRETEGGGSDSLESTSVDNAVPVGKQFTDMNGDTTVNLPVGQAAPSEEKTTPPRSETVLTSNEDGSLTDGKAGKLSLNDTANQIPTNTTEINDPKKPKQETPPIHRVRKTREQIREEEMRRRFPGRRPWPTLEECEEKPVPKTVVFTSTWLSVTAKGIK